MEYPLSYKFSLAKSLDPAVVSANNSISTASVGLPQFLNNYKIPHVKNFSKCS